jgi:aspartyl-tRNA(Asn)/glutamyl-tRNA(Gln) amidotransferase subunit A
VTTDLTRSTAADLADLLAQGSVSAREVTQAHLDRTAAVDGAVHSYLHVDADGALAQADEVDRRRAAGESLHAMAGVPIAVKDVMTTRGLPTTCGSKILQGWVPPYDATLVTRLREAGMPILGKTNMDEFAMGSSTEHSAYGPSHNPWDLDRIPGGSGGGSSSVVASFQAPLAIGTDTGGSIRQPAAGHRHRRDQADLRRGLALRPRGARVLARPGRPVHPHGARRRAAPRGHRWARPDRLDLDRRPGAARRRGRPPRRRQPA